MWTRKPINNVVDGLEKVVDGSKKVVDSPEKVVDGLEKVVGVEKIKPGIDPRLAMGPAKVRDPNSSPLTGEAGRG